jgi:hypothetical protein
MRRSWLGLVVLLAVACGPSAQQRTLRATLVTVNAARDAFLVWDRTHQSLIVHAALELQQAKRELASYRSARETIVLLFETVYKAIAVAALDPSDAAVVKASEAARSVLQATATIGMPAPPAH